ncbi:ATP-binding protein involved in chromosome partitioning [Arthrobacter sp. 1088]|uniref:Mrp/NBP35 family ATP-binding protein n=1 Tax=Arthrobacter sp. 1088 TaxID=2817768 RepID=UPI00285E359D|nr:Mrp/NBP35 family ATP-binding protein [Arthrobacter sp. 1088]MDR6688762.1 ATP-binding protein involved in chromosome partitioning [Arthrobacter sp. 1088]
MDGFPAGIAAAVREAVGRVSDPELRRPLAELDMIKGVEVTGGVAVVGITLTISTCPAAARIERDVHAAATAVDGVKEVRIDVGVMTPEQRAALTAKLREGRSRSSLPFTKESLTRVIAVSSGKGGVGKSTVTTNLAAAMAARGLSVGIIDADVYGFSVPGLLGLFDSQGKVIRPTRIDHLVLPPVAHGIKAVSIGMFLPEGAEDTAVSWRGPMLHRTMEQFLNDVYFGDLDVLLIDLPPGTGDIAISVGQILPHAEVIVVTTPQPAASEVAVRSGILAREFDQRVIGVVETMSPMLLADGSSFEPFGAGGGAAAATKLSAVGSSVPLLASIPFSTGLRSGGDTGVPIIAAAPEDPAARAFTELAERLAVRPRGLPGRRLPVSPASTP